MKSMKRTKVERTLSTKGAIAVDREEYPWGLQVRLDDESLKKLGRASSDFKPGATYFIMAKAQCTEMGLNADKQSKRGHVELQITHLDVADEKTQAERDFDDAFSK